MAERVAVRDYPFGSLGAHLLGYVGEISPAELAKAPDKYALGDDIETYRSSEELGAKLAELCGSPPRRQSMRRRQDLRSPIRQRQSSSHHFPKAYARNFQSRAPNPKGK